MIDDELRNGAKLNPEELVSFGWELFRLNGNPGYYLFYRRLKDEEENEMREKLR
ncbi:MAG: hypothetical protein IJY70_05995 [Clostridia bacterium]|nr:hypothetical protein [Clostridia bacterium]